MTFGLTKKVLFPKVKIGNLSRGGKSRQEVKTDDHDFGVIDTITPFGVYVPEGEKLSFYMVRSKVTSDCCVDIREQNFFS